MTCSAAAGGTECVIASFDAEDRRGDVRADEIEPSTTPRAIVEHQFSKHGVVDCLGAKSRSRLRLELSHSVLIVIPEDKNAGTIGHAGGQGVQGGADARFLRRLEPR